MAGADRDLVPPGLRRVESSIFPHFFWKRLIYKRTDNIMTFTTLELAEMLCIRIYSESRSSYH